jgi:hypothetical protein
MMMTVKQYVESRDSSETTIKRRIKSFGWELPINPLNKKQRLLSTEHQRLLDESIGYTTPAVEPEILEPVQHYERSESVALALAENAILQTQITPLRTAEDNPLYQALQKQVQALQRQNDQQIQAIYQQGHAQRDTDAAIEAMDQLAIAQRAMSRATQHHQLEQDLYNQTRTQLNLATRGLPVNQPPAPTPQTSPQSTASSSGPDWL